MILFYILAKKYALITGFIPINNEILINKFTMNKGILSGALLSVVGLSGFICAVVLWGRSGFGDLDPIQMCRITILSVMFFIMGIGLIFNSFFLGILEIKVKK